LVEGPEVRPCSDGVREVLSYFSLFPPRKDGDWILHHRVTIPESGDWGPLKRLIQSNLPPAYKLPLGQIQIWPDYYEFEVGTGVLKIRRRTGAQVVQALEPLPFKSRCSGAGYGFLVKGFIRTKVAGRPCRLPAFFVVLPRLLRLKKTESPEWLHPWVNAKEVGICEFCRAYFALRKHGRFCRACSRSGARMKAWRQSQREGKHD